MTDIASKIERPPVRHRNYMSPSMSVYSVALLVMSAPHSATADTVASNLTSPSIVQPCPIDQKTFFVECLVSDMESDFETKIKFRRRLEYLKTTLKSNWNGENDYPIEEEAYINTKAAINGTAGRLLKHWDLFPDSNGTLLFSPKDDAVAGISVGNKEFSYAAYISDDYQLNGKEPFSLESFKDALLKIHRMLGYV